LLDAVCNLLAEVTFGLLQTTGHIGSADTDLLAKGGIEPFELTCNLRSYIHLRGSCDTPQQNGREPKQDKGSDEDGNQK
jgi:hypothetical protein